MNDLERPILFLAEAKYGEVVVERRGTVDAQSEHDGETGSVGDGEILIRKVQTDCPRGLQIRSADRLDHGDAASKSIPESFSRAAV